MVVAGSWRAAGSDRLLRRRAVAHRPIDLHPRAGLVRDRRIGEPGQLDEDTRPVVQLLRGRTKAMIVGPGMEEHVGDRRRERCDDLRAPADYDRSPALTRRRYLDARSPRATRRCAPQNGDPRAMKVRQKTGSARHRRWRTAWSSSRCAPCTSSPATPSPRRPGDPLLARVAAAQLRGARNALIMENHRRTLEGDPLDTIAEDCAAYAEPAFGQVEKGLHGYPGPH